MADVSASKPLINLVRGWPSDKLQPTKAISDAAQVVLSDPKVSIPALHYGPDPGYGPLRESIASWNNDFFATKYVSTGENITITGGASQNLACTLQVFSDPTYTRNIWLVAPAYMLVFRIFQDNGYAGKMRAVPEDDEGIDIEYLQREIEKSEKSAIAEGNNEPKLKPKRSYSKYYKHIIYCVPTFSNPSSKTMSLARREALIQVARDYDALVVSDDVYDQIQWPADPSALSPILKKACLPRLIDVDNTLSGGQTRPGADGFGNAMSNGSFSKILGPGLRVGWAQSSTKFAYGLSQTGTSCSGGAPSQLTSTYVNEMLISGVVDKHIQETLQPAYARRYRLLIDAVEKDLVPHGCRLPQPGREVVGGYFTWVSLPKGVDASEFAQRCQDEENVIVAPGNMFEVPGDDSTQFNDCIRLTFSYEDEDKLVEGIRRAGTVLARYLGSGAVDAKNETTDGARHGMWSAV